MEAVDNEKLYFIIEVYSGNFNSNNFVDNRLFYVDWPRSTDCSLTANNWQSPAET